MKADGDKDANIIMKSEQEIAPRYIFLSEVLVSIEVARELILTAFCLHPTSENFELVTKSAILSERMDKTKSCTSIQSNLSLQLKQNNLKNNKTCPNHKSDNQNEPTEFCNECKVLTNNPNLNVDKDWKHVIDMIPKILTTGDEIPDHIRHDLLVVISSPRIKNLSWSDPWPTLKSNCQKLTDTQAKLEIVNKTVANANDHLKFLNLDYNQFRHLPVVEYSGIEKGYEMFYRDDDDDDNYDIQSINSDYSKTDSSSESERCKRELDAKKKKASQLAARRKKMISKALASAQAGTINNSTATKESKAANGEINDILIPKTKLKKGVGSVRSKKSVCNHQQTKVTTNNKTKTKIRAFADILPEKPVINDGHAVISDVEDKSNLKETVTPLTCNPLSNSSYLPDMWHGSQEDWAFVNVIENNLNSTNNGNQCLAKTYFQDAMVNIKLLAASSQSCKPNITSYSKQPLIGKEKNITSIVSELSSLDNQEEHNVHKLSNQEDPCVHNAMNIALAQILQQQHDVQGRQVNVNYISGDQIPTQPINDIEKNFAECNEYQPTICNNFEPKCLFKEINVEREQQKCHNSQLGTESAVVVFNIDNTCSISNVNTTVDSISKIENREPRNINKYSANQKGDNWGVNKTFPSEIHYMPSKQQKEHEQYCRTEDNSELSITQLNNIITKPYTQSMTSDDQAKIEQIAKSLMEYSSDQNILQPFCNSVDVLTQTSTNTVHSLLVKNKNITPILTSQISVQQAKTEHELIQRKVIMSLKLCQQQLEKSTINVSQSSEIKNAPLMSEPQSDDCISPLSAAISNSNTPIKISNVST